MWLAFLKATCCLLVLVTVVLLLFYLLQLYWCVQAVYNRLCRQQQVVYNEYESTVVVLAVQCSGASGAQSLSSLSKQLCAVPVHRQHRSTNLEGNQLLTDVGIRHCPVLLLCPGQLRTSRSVEHNTAWSHQGEMNSKCLHPLLICPLSCYSMWGELFNVMMA